MFLKSLSLQNFRNHKKKSFDFSSKTSVIVGPNTSGKTNILEAISFLSFGKSQRAEKDVEVISFGEEEMARVKGNIENTDGEFILEAVIATGSLSGGKSQVKKFSVNQVAKRRLDFEGNLSSVLFSPQDLEIVIESPGLRRKFLDEVLELSNRDYRLAKTSYDKGLRQRNALLQSARESGVRNEKQLEYWDGILIENGGVITQKRQELIEFFNSSSKDVFDFAIFYDKSNISKERLEQYKNAEVASGVTLVGPHRDDFSLSMYEKNSPDIHDIKLFGSRGQQRLTILQLKLLELDFIEKEKGERPIFLLDDIFSELDEAHIQLVLEEIPKQQTILTTTHEEFVSKDFLKEVEMIELQSNK